MNSDCIESMLNTELLINSISEGLCIFSASRDCPDLELNAWNRQMEIITGYALEDMNKNGFDSLFLTKYEKTVEQYLTNFLLDETETKLSKEYFIISKDGKTKILSANVSKMPMKNGNTGAIALVRDITETKYIQQELMEYKERYRKMLEFSTDAVFIHNNGIIVYANPSAVKLLEASSEEDLIGKDMMKFIAPDCYELIYERMKLTQACYSSLPVIEEKFLSMKGKTVYVEVAATNIPINGVKNNLVFARNISYRKSIEKVLREREAMLSRVTENTLDLIAICDSQGIVTYATPSHFNVLGYTAEELIGTRPNILIHSDELNFVENSFEKMKKLHQITKIQCRLKCKNGNYKNVEICGKPLYDKELFQGYVLSSRDITDRIGTEEALRKSEKKYRKLFNNVNDSIYLYRFDENGLPGEFIEVNDIACKRLGYKREELLNMNVREFNPFITENDGKSISEKLMTTGQEMHEAINRTKDGSYIPVEVNSILVEVDNEQYILSISRDITERKESERALKHSEERYRMLIESLPFGVYIRTRERILFSNKTGLEYLGISSMEEACGRMFSSIVRPHDDYKENYEKTMAFVAEYQYLLPTEEKYIRISDNKVLDIETVATKWNYDYTDDAYLVVIRDISDRRKAEELERSMEEKSKQLNEVFEYEKMRTEFFANISHELRTPVNVIFSTIQLLNFSIDRMNINNLAPDKFKKHMDTMKQNCYRLIRLINNLIDATRIDYGYLDLNLSNSDIVNVIEDITLSVASYIEDKDIALIFDTDTEEKIMAFDTDKIERIMLNLISNAVKFTESGGTIYVNICDRENSVIISVRDTGIGISEEKQKLIFERFVQVDKSLTRRREGSGIGLSLVKSLVEMHNGTISVKSTTGRGSEFIIKLPVFLVEEKEINTEARKLSAQANIEKIDIEFSDIY